MASNANNHIYQFVTEDGAAASGYSLYVYAAGTSTPITTYQDQASTITNTNPIVLDDNGLAKIWIAQNAKFVLKDTNSVTVYTVDNIPSISENVLDNNGNELVVFTGVTSAVNYITITNAATGSGPIIGVDGSDTNIDLNILPKGTGTVNFKGTATAPAEVRLYEDTDNGTNYMGIKAPSAVTASKTLELPDGWPAAQSLTKVSTAGVIAYSTLTAAAETVLDDATVSDMVNTLGGASSTGTGGLVRATSPTLVTPILGTPTSGTLTNCTGLPVSSGISGLGTGVATFLATPSSANLASAVTDETGSGALVFATSPTLTTPNIGVATGTSFNGLVGVAAQSDQETATSTALAVTSGRQQYHPSAAKAWLITPTGFASIANSYNVTSLSDDGVGRCGVTLTTAFSSTNYCVVMGLGDQTGVENVAYKWWYARVSSSTFNMAVQNDEGNTSVDSEISMAAYGDQ